MQITTPALSNVTYPQTMASSQGTSKGLGVTVCTTQSRCFNDSAQRPEHKPLSEYRVGQLARGVLQAGTGLMRSTAGFVFRQVMNSPEVSAVAPGLKENLLMLATLYNELQPTQAQCTSEQFHCSNDKCIEAQFQCDDQDDCGDLSDEGSMLCNQAKCDDLGRGFLCDHPDRYSYSGEYSYSSSSSSSYDYNECISDDHLCNGIPDCDDPKDEGPAFCDQAKCDEIKRGFLCNHFNSEGRHINNTCISFNRLCDGVLQCHDPEDEGPGFCDQAKCIELGRSFLCNNKCVPINSICNNFDNCGDNSDEGEQCTLEKCEDLGRFICQNNKCINSDDVCDKVDNCGDNSDEESELCTPTINSAWFNEAAYSADTESSANAWFALPAVLTVGAAAAYGISAYKSYHAFRRDDQASSGIQLFRKALTHPLYFRQPHQVVAGALPMQAVDIEETGRR